MTATIAPDRDRNLWLALAVLQVFDVGSTAWWLYAGGREANPAMALVFAAGAWGLLAVLFVKLLLVWRCSQAAFPTWMVWVAFALYGGCALWNLHVLVRGGW